MNAVPKRYILAFMTGLGMALMYGTRMNINIAIIGMAESKESITLNKNATCEPELTISNFHINKTHSQGE